MHLDTIEAMAKQAKARIAGDMEAVRPVAAPPFEPPSTPKRYNVSFDDVFVPQEQPAPPAFQEAPQAAVSFDDVLAGQVDSDGIPVWEEPP